MTYLQIVAFMGDGTPLAISFRCLVAVSNSLDVEHNQATLTFPFSRLDLCSTAFASGSTAREDSPEVFLLALFRGRGNSVMEGISGASLLSVLSAFFFFFVSARLCFGCVPALLNKRGKEN